MQQGRLHSLACLTLLLLFFKIMSLCEHACISEGRGQKKVSESLRLELQVVESCHVGVGNQTLKMQ